MGSPARGGEEAAAEVAAMWRDFGERQAGPKSPSYREIAVAMSGDEAFCELLASRPVRERQPNLVLAAVRFLGGDVSSAAGFSAGFWERRDEVLDVMATRRTQTNEVGRCAALLPILASLPQPLALLELGASAGLCLLLDRYSYDYGEAGRLGDGDPLIGCEPRGPFEAPRELPRIAWRAGIDLSPVDPTDPDERRWLEALVWPEEHDRAARLAAALHRTAEDPPRLVAGDMRELLEALAAEAPSDAHLCVIHTAALIYLERRERIALADRIRALPGSWIAGEHAGVLDLEGGFPPGDDGTRFELALDGRVVADCDPHGRWFEWR